VRYTVSLLSFDGRNVIPATGHEELICALPKNNTNVPSELSIKRLRQFAPSIPINMLCTGTQSLRTKQGGISKTAVRQVVGLARR
jgi:hypothetical protein